MTIESAASLLSKQFEHKKWFTAVGIGVHNENPCLYLYVSKIKPKEVGSLIHGFGGFHVEVKEMKIPEVRM